MLRRRKGTSHWCVVAAGVSEEGGEEGEIEGSAVCIETEVAKEDDGGEKNACDEKSTRGETSRNSCVGD